MFHDVDGIIDHESRDTKREIDDSDVDPFSCVPNCFRQKLFMRYRRHYYHEIEVAPPPWPIEGGPDSAVEVEELFPDVPKVPYDPPDPNEHNERFGFQRHERDNVAIEQDGDSSVFQDMLMNSVPGLAQFINEHPAIAVVLSTTWLTRSFYSCRHTAGMIATIVELTFLTGLSVGTNTVAMFAEGVISYFKELRSDAPDVAKEQGVGDFVSLFAVLGKGLTGDPTLGREDYQRVQMFRSSLGTMKDAVGFIKTGALVVEFMKSCVRRWIFGPNEQDRVEDMVNLWADKVSEFALVDMQDMTTERAHQFIEFYEVGLSLQRMAFKWPDALKLSRGPLFARTLTEAAKVYQSCLQYKRNHGSRAEPFHLVIHGTAGALKSLVCQIISNRIVVDTIGHFDEKLVHTINFDLDHFDGYRPSTVVTVIDDYLQMTDEISRKSATGFVFSSVNHAQYTLPMAALSEKGLEFRSSMVVSTTNVDITLWEQIATQSKTTSTISHDQSKNARDKIKVSNTPPVSSIAGFLRRHHLIVQAEVRDPALVRKIRSSGSASIQSMDAAIRFKVIRETEDPLDFKVGHVLSFSALMEIASTEVKRRAVVRDAFMASIKSIAESSLKPPPPSEKSVVDQLEERFKPFRDSVSTFFDNASSRLETIFKSIPKDETDSIPIVELTPEFLDNWDESSPSPSPSQPIADEQYHVEPVAPSSYPAGLYWTIRPYFATTLENGLQVLMSVDPNVRPAILSAPPGYIFNDDFPYVDDMRVTVRLAITERCLPAWWIAEEMPDEECFQPEDHTGRWLERGEWDDWRAFPEWFEPEDRWSDDSDAHDTDEDVALEQSKTRRFVPEDEPPQSRRQRRRAKAREQFIARRQKRGDAPRRVTPYPVSTKPRPLLDDDVAIEQGLFTEPFKRKIFFSLLIPVLRSALSKIGSICYGFGARAIFWLVTPVTMLRIFCVTGAKAAWTGARQRYAGLTEKDKKYLLIMTVIVVLVLIIGLVYYFRVSEDQATEEYDAKERRVRKDPKPKDGPKKVKPYHIHGVAKTANEQNATDANLESIKNAIIMTSIGRISFIGIDRKTNISTSLFCVGHDIAEVPRHLWTKAQEQGGFIQVHLPKKTGGDMFSTKEFQVVADVPGTDVIFLRHPYFQVKKKDGYFVSHDEIPRALRGDLFLLTFRPGPTGLIPSEISATNPAMTSTPYRGHSSGYSYTAGCLIVDCPTVAGDCGAILMVRDPTLQSGRILGFHFAQVTVKGTPKAAITLVTREMITEVLGVPRTADEQFADYTDVGLSERLAWDLFSKAPNVRFHGFSRKFVYSPDKVSILRSPIADDLGPATTVVSKCTNDLSGCQYGFSKMDRSKPYITKEEVRRRIGDTAYRWPAPYLKEILDIRDAVEGDSHLYMAPIRQASGPGYGFRSQGGKFPFLSRPSPNEPRVLNAELIEKMKVKLEEAAVGRSFNPYEEYQKGERLAAEKLLSPEIDPDVLARNPKIPYTTANRLTNAGQLDTQILMRGLFAPWLDMMRRQIPQGPSMIGFNPWSFHWEILEMSADHIRYRVWSLDGRAWDISIPLGVLEYVSDQILLWFEIHCPDGLNWLRDEFLRNTFERHYHIVAWIIFSRDGLASGNIITTEGNNAINETVNLVITDVALERMGYEPNERRDILADSSTLKMFFYGDDSKVFVKDSLWNVIDQQTFAEIGEEVLGMQFISGDKTKALEPWAQRDTCKFLSRQTVVLDGVRFGAFPIDDCVEIARWVTDFGNPLEMARDNCEAALREIFFHGRAQFDKWHHTFSASLARRGSKYLIRTTYDQIYGEIFGKSQDAEQLQTALLPGAHFDYGMHADQSSQVELIRSIVRQEEDGEMTILERGVRLLKNKGYPVDVPRMLGLLAEPRSCNRLLRKDQEQFKTFITPYSFPLQDEDMDPNVEGDLCLEQSQDLRDTQTLPVVSRTETQTTADQSKDIVSTEPVPTPLSLYDAAGNFVDQGMRQALSRPYEVYSGQWLSTDASGTRHVLLNFPEDLFKIPQIQEKLSWFAYFRCKAIKLTIRLNLTSFHYGALAVSHVEGQVNWGPWLHDGFFRQCLNNRPVFLTAMGSPTTEIVLPWTLPFQWFPVIMTGGSYDPAPDANPEALCGFIQRVQMHVVQPLSALGTSVVPGTVTIFANFVDPEVQGPTLNTDPFPGAPPIAIEQSSSSADLEGIAKAVSGLIVGGESKPSGKPHKVSPVDITRVMGTFLEALDKPTLPEKDKPFLLDNGITMGYASGAEHASKNTLYADAHLPDTKIYGGGNMSWKQFVQTPSCLDLVAIPGATYEAGDLVKSWYVHPCFNTYEDAAGTGTMVPTFLQHGVAPFKWWRGSLRYQIRFFAPRFTTARFRLVWIPSDKGLASVPPAALGSADVGNLYSTIIDVSGDTIANISIPWLSPVPYRLVFPKQNMYTDDDLNELFLGGTANQLSLGTANGTLSLYVVNDLTSPATTVPVNITFAIFVAGGEDIQVGFYTGYGNFGVTPVWYENEPPAEAVEQSGDLWKDFQQPFDPITPSVGYQEDGAVMPEKVGTIVDLIKRYEASNTFSMITNVSTAMSMEASSIGYWCTPFVWARGGYRLKCIINSTPNSYILSGSRDGMYTTQAALLRGNTARISADAVVTTAEHYPYIPMSYWPLGVALDFPRSTSTGYFPFCAAANSSDATYPANGGNLMVQPMITDGAGSPFYFRSVTDDFALYGLYSPLVWTMAEPPPSELKSKVKSRSKTRKGKRPTLSPKSPSSSKL